MFIDTSGPAFPCAEVRSADGQGIRQGHDGMTLRDWFAGQCLPELIRLSMDSDGGWACENAANGAYNMADAMLEARKVK